MLRVCEMVNYSSASDGNYHKPIARRKASVMKMRRGWGKKGRAGSGKGESKSEPSFIGFAFNLSPSPTPFNFLLVVESYYNRLFLADHSERYRAALCREQLL